MENLEEMFKDIAVDATDSIDGDYYVYLDNSSVNECIKISNKHAINFSIWKEQNCYNVMDSKLFFFVRDSEFYKDGYTIRELLEIYNNDIRRDNS